MFSALQWRDDFLVEYWGEGTPCMGTIHATPPEQVFLHGEIVCSEHDTVTLSCAR